MIGARSHSAPRGHGAASGRSDGTVIAAPRAALCVFTKGCAPLLRSRWVDTDKTRVPEHPGDRGMLDVCVVHFYVHLLSIKEPFVTFSTYICIYIYTGKLCTTTRLLTVNINMLSNFPPELLKVPPLWEKYPTYGGKSIPPKVVGDSFSMH